MKHIPVWFSVAAVVLIHDFCITWRPFYHFYELISCCYFQGHAMFEIVNTSYHFTCCYCVTVATPMSDCSWKTLYTVSRGQAVDDCLDGYSQTRTLIRHTVRCYTAGMICDVVGLLLLLLLPKTSMEILSMFPTWRWVELNKSEYWLNGICWVVMEKNAL